jgi:hypothetical protein
MDHGVDGILHEAKEERCNHGEAEAEIRATIAGEVLKKRRQQTPIARYIPPATSRINDDNHLFKSSLSPPPMTQIVWKKGRGGFTSLRHIKYGLGNGGSAVECLLLLKAQDQKHSHLDMTTNKSLPPF